jgi:hypothetical protein
VGGGLHRLILEYVGEVVLSTEASVLVVDAI